MEAKTYNADEVAKLTAPSVLGGLIPVAQSRPAAADALSGLIGQPGPDAATLQRQALTNFLFAFGLLGKNGGGDAKQVAPLRARVRRDRVSHGEVAPQ
jgi:hypothetical protein